MSQKEIKNVCRESVQNEKDLLITVYKLGMVRELDPISTEQLRFRPSYFDDRTDELKGYYLDSEILSRNPQELAVNFILAAEILDRQ